MDEDAADDDAWADDDAFVDPDEPMANDDAADVPWDAADEEEEGAPPPDDDDELDVVELTQAPAGNAASVSTRRESALRTRGVVRRWKQVMRLLRQ